MDQISRENCVAIFHEFPTFFSRNLPANIIADIAVVDIIETFFFGPIHHAVRLTKKTSLQRIPTKLKFQRKNSGIVKNNVHIKCIIVQSIYNGVFYNENSVTNRQNLKKKDLELQNGSPRYQHQTRKIQQKRNQTKVRITGSYIVPSNLNLLYKITQPTGLENCKKAKKNSQYNTPKTKQCQHNETATKKPYTQNPNTNELKLVLSNDIESNPGPSNTVLESSQKDSHIIYSYNTQGCKITGNSKE